MPKQLINTVGLLIVIAILGAGVALVALPIFLQAGATHAQAQAVSASNDQLQFRVDSVKSQDPDDVAASLADVTEQIPAEPRMDTVSSLITNAAAATGTTIMTFAPGVQGTFNPAAAAAADTKKPASTADVTNVTGAGKTQIAVEFTATAPDLDSMLAFLDALREGPRLLGDVTATVSTRNGGADATIDAVAFAYIPASK